MTRRNTVKGSQLKFHQKLILNRYVLSQLGATDFHSLATNLKNPELEEIDAEGVTGFYKQFVLHFASRCTISEDVLTRYDLNIVSHLRKINKKRSEPIKLKYFQYLALLFVEYYLDTYFTDRQALIDGLNADLCDFNARYPNDALAPYGENDLNKIAIWSATGSGKTLIMHINYHQYMHYAGAVLPDDATYILLTPKEGLSIQHIEGYGLSGIPAQIYDKNMSRWMRTANEISVLENTRLDNKDQDKIVSVKRFGNRNVVFVDEGHRGSSSGKKGSWQKFRDELCSDGFSFEYSATFGQAIAAANDKSLYERYAKCIIFDYSYKYFYKDGYGKDYNIINLPDDSDAARRNTYLTGCLLAYYQQKKLYLAGRRTYGQFNIENPLFVFVGARVNAVRTELGRKVSDVINILLFIKKFITNASASIANIRRIISGRAGLLDSENRDIFRNAFSYLIYTGLSPQAIYSDILKIVFNCLSAGTMLHIENLKGVDGEISLRLGENDPFGVINVGDEMALLKLCAENGFNTSSIDFSKSLFQGITKEKSTINLLIGSKKFTEGWNCWRVSTMGLMNIGRREGSEIIQLFGRGVRLKGVDLSLKRSGFYKRDHPETIVPRYIEILETLNIFGVRADYMKQFREFLENEGVPSKKGPPIVLKMPVIRNKQYKNSDLYTLHIKDAADYKNAAPKPFLGLRENIMIVLDCYSKVQFESSKERDAAITTKNSTTLKPENLTFLDFDAIYSELQRYKAEKNRHNVNITRQSIHDLLYDTSWYKLLIADDDLTVRSFEDYKRFERIAVSLLIKYFDKLYSTDRNHWEANVVGYDLAPMDDSNENFLNDESDNYSITIDETDENETAILWLEKVIAEVNEARTQNRLPNFTIPQQGDLEALALAEHLYNPLLYLAKGNLEIGILPVALNESELGFVKDLKKYLGDSADIFAAKELYLIRNRSKKGVSFFETSGFYPDFIMWLIADGKQNIIFIDPHGMSRESINSEKVTLHKRIKTDIEVVLSLPEVKLYSFILSPTKYSDLPDKNISVAEWNANNVLFMEDNNYIEKMFSSIGD